MANIRLIHTLRIVGGLALLTFAVGLGLSTLAQEQNQPPTFQPLNSVVRKGFTRPGSPADGVKDNGKVQRVSFSGSYKGLGGTVFFVVLERLGEEGDTWGVGARAFDQSFRPGLDFDGKYSPRLDQEAKYLYLYQVVNDRGLEPIPIRPAAANQSEGNPIATALIRLRVDPRYITSWGQFAGQGLQLGEVYPRKFDGTVAVAEGEKEKTAILPVSAFPGIQHELLPQPYEVLSPAYNLRNPMSLGRATQKVGPAVMQNAAKILPASFQKNIKNAEVRANEPSFVQLSYAEVDTAIRLAQAYNQFYQSNNDGIVDNKNFRPTNLNGEVGKQLVFRADWIDKETIKVGQHSPVFGFTTDLPPLDGSVVLKDPKAMKTNIQQVAFNDGAVLAELAAGIAPGTAPSPQSPAPAAPAVPAAGGAGVGTLGGQVGGGGVGGGGGIGFPAGFGVAPAGTGGFGGGTGGGNGGGNGMGEGDTDSGTDGDSTADVIVNQSQNVNQRQGQGQSQRQRQRQRQRDGDNPPPGEVIPAPAALFLGLLGLPALYFVGRRRKKRPLAKKDITVV